MTRAWPDDRHRPPPPSAGAGPIREPILRAAASLASVSGLDRVTIGNLAAALGVSKSSLHAHFGSKLELQLAIVAEAARVFDQEVVKPALAAPAGLGQLTAVCEAFFAHLERHTFPGGCFMASAGLETVARPGPVSDLITGFQARFGELLRGHRRGRWRAAGGRGPGPAGLRAERHHAGRRHQLRPARGPGRARPGPADRAPAAER